MDIQRKAFESAMQELSGGQTKNDVNPVTGEYQYGVMQVMWSVWQKAQAALEGFVLISAEQMSQWGHMANYAEEYGCPECYEARGYAHSLACEINEFLATEAQEPTND